jgi:chitodextrinase
VGGSVLTFTDSVAAGTQYTYRVRAFDAAGNYSVLSNAMQVTTPASQPTACPAPAQGAFTGCYYNNPDLTGAPALVRTDNRIDFDWTFTPPAPAVSGPSFSVRWQGGFQLSAGTYNFTVVASDGIRVYVDGALILDRWRDQPVSLYVAQQALTSGSHMITVEYYQRAGAAKVYVAWVNSAPVVSVPVITSFTAAPSNISAGQQSTLNWAVSGASTVSINNGIGNVSGAASRAVSPAQTTTYVLTASNGAGQATASVTVNVAGTPAQDTTPPTRPVITSAAASAATRVDLTWTASTDNIGVVAYRIIRNGMAVGLVPSPGVSYADSTVLPGITYTYAVQAFDGAGNYSAASTSATVTTPAAPVQTGCTPGMNVFTGCYYSNTNLTGTPVLIRTDPAINFDWTFNTPGPSLPSNNYSVRWEGSFTFQAGYYTFNATTSDGMRIYIDGTLILDRWRDQPVFSYAIRRFLTAGMHLITVEYYERTGSATARLSWQGS